MLTTMKHINALLNDNQARNLNRILLDYLELTKENEDIRIHRNWTSFCTQDEIKELQEVLS